LGLNTVLAYQRAKVSTFEIVSHRPVVEVENLEKDKGHTTEKDSTAASMMKPDQQPLNEPAANPLAKSEL